jgi:FKBP-type peptidyl-prolyl cis-trans isomerase FklB
MLKNSTLYPKPMLLAGFLAGSMIFMYGQDTTSPATKPAAKKPANAAKTTGTKTAPASTPALNSKKDKVSYAIGADLGKKLKTANIDVDPAILTRAMKDTLTGAKSEMSDDEIRATLTDLSKDLQQKQAMAAKEASEKNRKAGEEFLAANKGKEGVVALPDGLQYKVLTAGNGPKPSPSDTVVCNYKGTLIDGKEFDSSYKRGQPATFPVSGVIKGWTEALQMMPVGSRWQLFIPPDLAYGDRQAGPDITPGSTLVFEVELMSIQPKTAAAPEGAEKAAPDKSSEKAPDKTPDKSADKTPDKPADKTPN